jgi:hypothetical protein
MQLTYRGAQYEYTPPVVNVSDSPTVGQYRGAKLNFHQFRIPSLMQPTLDLVYRGVHFSSGSPTAGAA